MRQEGSLQEGLWEEFSRFWKGTHKGSFHVWEGQEGGNACCGQRLTARRRAGEEQHQGAKKTNELQSPRDHQRFRRRYSAKVSGWGTESIVLESGKTNGASQGDTYFWSHTKDICSLLCSLTPLHRCVWAQPCVWGKRESELLPRGWILVTAQTKVLLLSQGPLPVFVLLLWPLQWSSFLLLPIS